MRVLVTAVIGVFLSCPALAQMQPPGIELNPNGVSKVYPPFDSEGWVLTRGTGVSTHQGDDFHAQDWAQNCFSEGAKLYAGISGSVELNAVNDGSLDGYGNTVVITDNKAGFAQRFAHMQKFAPGLKNGDLVLAGQLIGTLGATGNVWASDSCAKQGGRGAHAHIALYKNLPKKPGGFYLTYAAPYSEGSRYAARFSYASPDQMIKADNNPTVYALVNGIRLPVTAAAFANRGLAFDKSKIVFDPIKGNVFSESKVNNLPRAAYFWPFREGALVKSVDDPTVYLVQDGHRKGVSYGVFICRGFGFADVRALPASEVGHYLPFVNMPVANGCKDEVRQAVEDFTNMINLDRRLGAIEIGTYKADFEWDPYWELRFVNFNFSNYRVVTVYHITSRVDSSVRFTMFWDPDILQWKGWYRMY